MRRLYRSFAIAIVVSVLLTLGNGLAQGPLQPDLTIDATVRAEVIEGIIKHLNEGYVFPDVAAKMEKAIRDRVEKKEYDNITSGAKFANLLTEHLQAVSRDKHLRVRYSHEPPRPQSGGDDSFFRLNNFGFEKVERLSGNVGYMDLRVFAPTEVASDTAIAAMNFLANTDALIVDLRRNGGGHPAMVALISSYLFDPQPVHLNSLYWRPTDKTHQWWTLPHVPGKRFGRQKDVYVLTSKRTFSAAEEFTYNLQNLKRATIIGETTGGGAHPGGVRRINDHFAVWVPSGRAINPISGTNWEGTGVKPDVDVPADLALKTAHLAALNKLLEKSKDERLKNQLKSIIETVQKELDGVKQPPEARR
ncbi:MAG: S41 family peptidase [Blastocatellia bacterium]|nr:S41 family peptidase [Blastocatellia bacterium]